MQISVVCAVAHNRVIGCRGRLPWRIHDEIVHFRRFTLGKTLVMGRNTFLSIGRALPGRKNIVISSDSEFKADGIEHFLSFEEALAGSGGEDLMVIGGAKLIASAWPWITDQYLTLIQQDFAGDVFYPDFNTDDWRFVSRFHHDIGEGSPYAWDFLHLSRK
ncbi:dihydrofolate reductase [bacterium]|nr:dihydrofolate reductase [bacterium]